MPLSTSSTLAPTTSGCSQSENALTLTHDPTVTSEAVTSDGTKVKDMAPPETGKLFAPLLESAQTSLPVTTQVDISF